VAWMMCRGEGEMELDVGEADEGVADDTELV
jgi:hypothetical protein